MSASAVIVEDRLMGRLDDFLITPVARRQLALGYSLSAWIAGVAVTALIWLLGVIVLIVGGYDLPDWSAAGRSALALIISCLVFSLMVSWLTLGLRSQSAFAACSTIVGTLSGFASGFYVPLFVLPRPVADLMGLLPFAQSASLTLDGWSLQSFSAIEATMPAQWVANAHISQQFSLEWSVGGKNLPIGWLWVTLTVWAALFAVFGWRQIRRVVKRR
jgi:multidrug/hemolysin transport system permease protein